MPIKETSSFQESFNLSPKLCPNCGLSYNTFLKTGKTNCKYCYFSFFKNKNQIFDISFKFPKLNIPENILSIPFEDVFWELVSNRNVSLRYRSARNIKGFNFDQQAKNNFSLLQTIQIIFFESNRKEILPQEKYNFGDYKIYFFDEDHVRLEYILKNNCDFLFYNNFPSDLWNNKKLFEYSNQLGYITSCPTNLGRGNKFSIKFNAMVSNNLPLFIELVNKNLLIMDSGSVDTNKPINLTFYIKNFNSISIKSFIYFSFYISNEFKF